MALASSKSLFLHIPKTGGMWIRHAYKVCNIDHFEIAMTHSHFPHLLNFKPKSFYSSLYSYAFVRHPLSWYQSRWAFRMRYGWNATHPLDYNCHSNDFQKFVEACLAYKPSGWVTNEYTSFIDEVPGGIKQVGRLENLVNDFLHICDNAGEAVSSKIITTMPRINDSDLDGQDSSHWARYTHRLIDRVLKAESVIMQRYYSDVNVDYDDYT